MVCLENLVADLKEKKDLRSTLSAIRKAIREGDKNIGREILSDTDACRAVIAGLDCDDAKARKSAALLIGDLHPDLSDKDGVMLLEALMDAYRGEDTMFVRESYLKSVIKLGGYHILNDEDAGYLKKRLEEIDTATFSEEDMKHILAERKALTAILDEPGVKSAAVFIEPDSFNALFVPVRGFYGPLKEAFRDRGIAEKRFSGIGALIPAEDIDRVRDVRLYSHMMYRVRGTFSGEASRMREDISGSDFLKFLRRTTRPEDTISVRFIVHEKKDHHTSAAKRFASEFLYLYRDRLINTAPYDMALHFYPKKSGGFALFVRSYDQKDDRFSYAAEKLSTSMQPVKAALMVYLVRKYLRADARVCDIFAGNGTLLSERDEYMKTRVMFACDTNADAIRAGKANAKHRGRDIFFVRRSAFTFESDEPFDEIISEFPDLYDTAEDDRKDFYEKTAAATERLLCEGGYAFYLAGGSDVRAMVRKARGLKFIEDIPFDEKRSIFVIERG